MNCITSKLDSDGDRFKLKSFGSIDSREPSSDVEVDGNDISRIE